VGCANGITLMNEGNEGFGAGSPVGAPQPRAPDPNVSGTDLTDKQRQVLDLLIQHKTSKEISRALGISPHTVDQRIMLSRAKLGVSSRSEVAQAYRRLIDAAAPREVAQPAPANAQPLCEQPVYGFSHVASPALPLHQGVRDDLTVAAPKPLLAEAALPQAALTMQSAQAGYYHVLPEKFDGPYGTVLRLGAIALITAFLILILMGGLAMFAQLSQILDR
jgi:DNA-binding CsgD family transcriptional regulator